MSNIWTHMFKTLNSITFGPGLKLPTDSLLILTLTLTPLIVLTGWGIHKFTKKLFPVFILENVFLIIWQFTCISSIAQIHPRLKQALSVGALVNLNSDIIYKPLKKIALQEPDFFYKHFSIMLKQVLYLGKIPLHTNCLWKSNVTLTIILLIMMAVVALCLFGTTLGSLIVANFIIISVFLSNACTFHFWIVTMCILTMYSIETQDCAELEEMIS